MIKILIADDHTLMREGLKQILVGSSDIQVAGEAANGVEALSKIRQLELDVLLLDLDMPGRSGLELIKQIKDEKPKLPILVLSMHKEDIYAGRVLKAGASGYLCKDGAPSQLVHAIRKLSAGGVFITQSAADTLALGLIPNRDALPHTLLSDREFQIFKLIAAGSGITEIADRLNISVKTVSTHKTRIMQKMNMESSADLIRYALKHGLADTSD
jgi:DNA-binding NarL/FixJ family response regulator